MQTNIAIYVVMACIAFAMLLIPALVWKVKYQGKMIPVLVGALTFFVFANVLEGLMHQFCLMSDNGLSRFIKGNMVTFMLYTAFAAGVFEETGRLVAFKTLLKKYNDRKDAVAYGIGHGGIEAILVLGVNYIVLTVAALSIGTPGEAQYAGLISAMGSLTPGIYFVAVFERIFAILFHISASVLVFTAARNREKFWLYPLAILLHAVLDMPAALYQYGVLNLFWVEASMAVYVSAAAYFAWRVYKARVEEVPEE